MKDKRKNKLRAIKNKKQLNLISSQLKGEFK
jgi:hypothetical protein